MSRASASARLAAWILGLVSALGAAGAHADTPCRLALALGLDVSGSVDASEYRLQREGLAAALRHPEIGELMRPNGQPPVVLMVYEWSAPGSARILLRWRVIDGAPTLADAARRIADAPRRQMAPATGLGAAIEFGVAQLATQPCWQRKLDLSGDGKSNIGPRPAMMRARARGAGVTINALVIGADAPASQDARFVEIGELVAYFRDNVLSGPDAFVETALGFAAYEAAMVRKLKRELSGLVLSQR